MEDAPPQTPALASQDTNSSPSSLRQSRLEITPLLYHFPYLVFFSL